MNECLRFVEELNNKELLWTFNIIGDRIIVGKVVDYTISGNATPITVMVQVLDIRLQGDILEIPWTSIQTIKLQGEQ